LSRPVSTRVASELALPCRVPELLGVARRCVPRQLASPAAWDRLESIDDPLPPLASEAAIECRLEAGASRVDFELCIRSAGDARRRLANAVDQTAARAAAARSPGWRRAFAFLRAWADEGSALHDAVSAVWLEFDAPGEGGGSEPFLVFTLNAERFYAAGRADPAALRSTLAAGLDLLADGVDRETAGTLSRCVDELPPCGQILHAAIRPTSDGDVARLVVRLPWREVPGALERLGWPGSPPALREQLERLCETTLVHSVNLDIGSRLGARVGIEFHHPTSPAEDPRWISLFDALEADAACTPEARSALVEWADPRRDPGFEPGAVRIRRELLVKVVHEPSGPLRAKAYLPFSPRLVLGV
jgi:hypothetical protein